MYIFIYTGDYMSTELSLDVIHSQLTAKDRLKVTEETVDRLQRLTKDPDYGDEFLENYLMGLAKLKQHVYASHEQYVNAVKFYTLVESDISLTDAYIMVFPERYQARLQGKPPAEANKTVVASEASRYNRSVLVNEIRQINAYPVQLIHRNLLHEAILDQAELMRTAKSDFIRQKAGQTLIQELRPKEETQLQIAIDDGTASAIEDLRKATEQLALAEMETIALGKATLDSIAKRKIVTIDAEVIDD